MRTATQTLTASGAGIAIDKDSLSGLSAGQTAQSLKSAIEEYKFVLIRDYSHDLEEVLELMSVFGPLNNAPTRDKGVLKLDTSQDNTEVLRSHEALPLHKDGLLTAFDVLMVGIYCMSLGDISGGRTYITDVEPALKVLPSEDLELLDRVGFEGLPVDNTGYYAKENATWHPFKAFVDNEKGEKTLHIGMPHLPGEKEGWKVRIPAVSQEESDRILYNMIDVFSRDPFVYYHDWNEGDIIIFDNYKVLHGREAFTGGPRELANIQVVRD